MHNTKYKHNTYVLGFIFALKLRKKCRHAKLLYIFQDFLPRYVNRIYNIKYTFCFVDS